MFISKINFNHQQAKNLNSQQKNYVSFKGLNSNILKNVIDSGVVTEKGTNIVKTALMSLTAFAALQGFTYRSAKEAAEKGELDMYGKKVNLEGKKTKDYLEKLELYEEILLTKTEFCKINGIKTEEFEQAVEKGELDMIGKKINPEGEKTKAYIQNLQLQRQLYRQTHMPKTAFGQLIGISIHSVEWHIKKGNINQKEDGTIDLTDPKNKFFLDNFKKLGRKQVYKYTPENYDKLQRKLGAIKLDFCLERGYLVADEDGSINIENPINKEFLEKVKNKEVNIFDFYMKHRDFARKIHQGDLTLKKAIQEGKVVVTLNKGIDPNHPVNKAYIEEALANQVGPGGRHVIRPEGYVSRKHVADILGITKASLGYHIQRGYLIADDNGIDLNNPVNKHFIENYEKGTAKEMPEGYEAVEVELKGNRITKPNHVGKYKFAERLGMSAATLEYHIQAGHVVYTKDGIDLTHPQNVHFMNNYRRGEEYLMPGEVKVVKTDDVIEKNKQIKTNFNQLNVGELSKMIKICISAIGFHFERGRLEKTEDKKIDLAESVNREFIAKYEDSVIEAYKNMSDEELEESIKDLKSLLKNRMGENIYITSEKLLEDLDYLHGYLGYSLEKIVNTSDLTEEQKELLTEMMEEIVLEELASDRTNKSKFFESSEKLDLLVYKNLLNEILKRQQLVTIDEKNETFEIVETSGISEEYDDDCLKTSEKLNDILDNIEKEYSREIDIYKSVMSQKVDILADAYAQYKFFEVSRDYFQLRNFNQQMLENGFSLETEEQKVKFIVEKVLSKVTSPSFDLTYNYTRWKKDYMPKNTEAVVSDLIDKYSKNLMAKICTEEALEELQKANPTKEILMQDLEDLIYERFDL